MALALAITVVMLLALIIALSGAFLGSRVGPTRLRCNA